MILAFVPVEHVCFRCFDFEIVRMDVSKVGTGPLGIAFSPPLPPGWVPARLRTSNVGEPEHYWTFPLCVRCAAECGIAEPKS